MQTQNKENRTSSVGSRSTSLYRSQKLFQNSKYQNETTKEYQSKDSTANYDIKRYSSKDGGQHTKLDAQQVISTLKSEEETVAPVPNPWDPPATNKVSSQSFESANKNKERFFGSNERKVTKLDLNLGKRGSAKDASMEKKYNFRDRKITDSYLEKMDDLKKMSAPTPAEREKNKLGCSSRTSTNRSLFKEPHEMKEYYTQSINGDDTARKSMDSNIVISVGQVEKNIDDQLID